MEFGRTLEKLRKTAGKSRYRLAQLSGLDEAFIGRLEKGAKNPSWAWPFYMIATISQFTMSMAY